MLTLIQCWMLLFVCIGCEVSGSICLKLSENYKYWLPSILIYVFYVLSLAGFPYVLTQIDLGTAYAVWSGVGTAATAMIGITYFSEKSTRMKWMGIALIIGGVIVLNYSEASEKASTTSINTNTNTNTSSSTSAMQSTKSSTITAILSETEATMTPAVLYKYKDHQNPGYKDDSEESFKDV